MADKSHADLLTELQVLREENERLKAALVEIRDRGDEGKFPQLKPWAIAAAALSPSPAQEEKK